MIIVLLQAIFKRIRNSDQYKSQEEKIRVVKEHQVKLQLLLFKVSILII